MSEAEVVDVRVDVREVGLEDLYVDLLDEEEAAVEAGEAILVRIEATMIPAAPGAPVVEAGALDFVLAKPISGDDIERALDEALADVAEFSSRTRLLANRTAIEGGGLDHRSRRIAAAAELASSGPPPGSRRSPSRHGTWRQRE